MLKNYHFRSADMALETLLKFKNMETQPVILEQLMTKFEVILDQFNKEVSLIEDIFLVKEI